MTESVISLTPLDLAIASLLVVVLAVLTWRQGVSRSLVIASVRMVVQLLLIGLVLNTLFDLANWYWVLLMAFVMLLFAGREVTARQKRRFRGFWGMSIGAMSLMVTTFAITTLTLTIVIQPDPWYMPQYAIPLLGMILGNSMTAVALTVNNITSGAWQQRREIEARLMLGQSAEQAIAKVRTESLHTGLIPIINAMAASGIVSLPGMMTGQILAGNPPIEAVKYQILIMFLIAGTCGFSGLVAVWLGTRRLFDHRDRLRLDRLEESESLR
jgi:putative ABC transport system permease protein